MAFKGKLFFILYLISSQYLFAQRDTSIYENRIYNPNIKTIQCYNTKKEQSIPIITLGSNDQLLISFDDLASGFKDYWYTIEHCTATWKSSNISSFAYLDSFLEDEITNYKLSSNTIQGYTHYEFIFPNEQIKPKISGNYILSVYEDRDKSKIIFTQRIYVLNQKIVVNVDNKASEYVQSLKEKQKLNFKLLNTDFIQNPYADIQVVSLQNFNYQTAQITTQPNLIQPNMLVYDRSNQNEFFGGNEYRKFDIRSLQFRGTNVQKIERDSDNVAFLVTDIPLDKNSYSSQIDENGDFFIRNQTGQNPNTQSDYVKVVFTLNTDPPTQNGDVYVVGKFNNHQLSPENRLMYDKTHHLFYGHLLLKQGLYDYKYIWMDNNTTTLNETVFEGSYFETNNTYQVFVYYHPLGARHDELIGYTNITTK